MIMSTLLMKTVNKIYCICFKYTFFIFGGINIVRYVFLNVYSKTRTMINLLISNVYNQ